MTEPIRIKVLSPGTIIHPPRNNRIEIEFLSEDDAIIFWEFCKMMSKDGATAVVESASP